MIDEARLAAFSAFDEVIRKKAYSNLALKQSVENLDNKQKAFAGALFYGALEKLITLDFILDKYIKSRPKPIIRNILRIGAYQIHYMNVPDHASVTTSAELAKKLGKKGAAGFINGVLRNVAREKKDFDIPENLPKVRYLSIKYSFPEWMIKMWISQLGEDETRKLLAYEKDNFFSIYPNALKGMKMEPLTRELDKTGVQYTKGYLLDDIIRTHGAIFDTNLFDTGKIAVQGEASHLAAKVAVENHPEKVLDLCAAPGGKTAAMALFNPEAFYTACDLHQNRVDIMLRQFERLGVSADTMVLDAAHLNDVLGEYDTVLVDAPCSALGTVFSHPEVKYNKEPKDIVEIIKTQKAIISNAAHHVRQGGRLIYATCTINRDENYDVVSNFAAVNPQFKPVFPKTFYGIINDKRFDGYGTTLFPHKDNTAGFYIACLEKING